jgi:hypothetical protein
MTLGKLWRARKLILQITFLSPQFAALLCSFFATLVPLVYFFIQHKVYRIPGGTLPGVSKFS